jgi:hypothetical protein
MNIAEISNEFDYAYNNSFSFSAPPINGYEKSIALTQAQEDIVLAKAAVFEKDERVREQLRDLVIPLKIDFDPAMSALNSNLTALKFHTNSKFFKVPADVWFLLSEYINDQVRVIPVTHDEFNINKNNPFKKPNINKAWRLDIANTIGSDNIREIIYPGAISTYTIRYLKKPTPIILEDLTPYSRIINGLTVDTTIDGLTAATGCVLSSEIQRDIIELAVKKAKLAYEENSLQNRAANNRDN